jgi:hypothetical protein
MNLVDNMKTIIQQLNDGLAEMAWSLWTELGVAGTFRRHKHCLVPLEELIILTAIIGDYDPRLREEALDWCSRYHHFVSVSRLKTLVKKIGTPIFEPFSMFASTLNTTTQSNWPIFSEVVPLKFLPSKKSVLPSLNTPALLKLRLRSFFGVGARADLFTYFLTEIKGDFTASDAVDIGYGKRSLAEILDSLALSGFLASTMIRNQRKYELAKTEQLKRLIGEPPEFSPPWHHILEILVSLRHDLYLSEKSSNATKVITIRNDLERMKDLLKLAHLSLPVLESDPDQYWKLFSKWLLDYVKTIAQGNFGRQFNVNSDFEKIFFSLIQHIYKVDDCLDGLEFILSYSKEDLIKHSEIYRESYQLSLSFLNELRIELQKLLDFPFHQLMDDKISDITYHYSKSHLQIFLEFTEKYTSLSQVNDPRQALKQYDILQGELNKLYNFMNELRNQLAKIYFSRTNIHLLTLPSELFKRHTIIKLYSS